MTPADLVRDARLALRQADFREQTSPDAAYSESACQAMQRIGEVCPPGALMWAREAHSALADKIDVELIVRLDYLWNTHAPIPDFESALRELVNVHAEVGKLFRKQFGLDVSPPNQQSKRNHTHSSA